MISLFAIPKPFDGSIAVIQMNALASWARLGCDVVLVGDENGTEDAAADFGFRHVPQIERSDFGTPLVSSVFAVGERTGSENLLCYINADIILLDDFLQTIRGLRDEPRAFLGTGQRWDIEVSDVLDPSDPGFEEGLRSRLTPDALHPPTGLDYFIFRRGFWVEMPPFALGRSAWDNWLAWSALSRHAMLIDCTSAITAIHQNHDYSHAPGGEDEVWRGREAQRNLTLAGGWDHISTLDDATHFITPDGSVAPCPPRPIPQSPTLIAKVRGRLLAKLRGNT